MKIKYIYRTSLLCTHIRINVYILRLQIELNCLPINIIYIAFEQPMRLILIILGGGEPNLPFTVHISILLRFRKPRRIIVKRHVCTYTGEPVLFWFCRNVCDLISNNTRFSTRFLFSTLHWNIKTLFVPYKFLSYTYPQRI